MNDRIMPDRIKDDFSNVREVVEQFRSLVRSDQEILETLMQVIELKISAYNDDEKELLYFFSKLTWENQAKLLGTAEAMIEIQEKHKRENICFSKSL